MGDFNQTIHTSDRSNAARGPDRAFASLVAALELMDLPLLGRRYTWSRGIENPTFVRLDRILISTAWSSKYPNTSQNALQSLLSDYCPLQCVISTRFPLPNTFRFENYWLKMTHFADLVTATWNNMEVASSPHQLSIKLQALQSEIKKWCKDREIDMDAQADVCNRTLLWITAAEEIRALTNLEKLLRDLVTQRVKNIDNIKETKWKQRAKTRWVGEGDEHEILSCHGNTPQTHEHNCLSPITTNGGYRS